MPRYPFFSRPDRKAILVVEIVALALIVGIFLGKWLGGSSEPAKEGETERGTLMEEMERILTPEPTPEEARRSGGRNTYAVEERQVELFDFDPNTADSTDLLRLGLHPRQVRAIYNYRARLGRYHRKEDFRKVPGMTEEVYSRLAPYIHIGKEYEYIDARAEEYPAPALDTVRYPVKYEAGTLVDINRADTSQLKKIPGIGSYRARRIVEHRDSLGGYVAIEQVMELRDMPADVLKWMKVDATRITRVRVNSASLRQLMKHPYINYDQASALVRLRQQGGPIHGWSEVTILDVFSADDIARLKPYLDFSL